MSLRCLHLSAMLCVTVVCSFFTWGCRNSGVPKRPDKVPASAILAPGGKIGGWWQYCKFNETDKQVYCTIWNVAGLVLYNGIFLPLDRQPLMPDEIKVVYNPRSPDNVQLVCLASGRILVPASEFDRLSKFFSFKRINPR